MSQGDVDRALVAIKESWDSARNAAWWKARKSGASWSEAEDEAWNAALEAATTAYKHLLEPFVRTEPS